MNKYAISAVAALMAANVSAITLAEANARIDEACLDSAAMASIVKELPAESQTAYLAQVNAAISALNESAEKKAALYLNAAKAALENAAEENKAAMLAEIFATMPVEYLPLFLDTYGVAYVNKEADPEKKMTAETYAAETAKLMSQIDARTSEGENAGVRDALAAIMFLKASGNPTPELTDSLLAQIGDEEARKLAKDEWIPAALGANGAEPSYSAILGAGDAGELPDVKLALQLADTTPMSGAFFANLATTGDESTDALLFSNTMLDPNEWGLPESMTHAGLTATPRTADPSDPWYSGYRRGGGSKGSNSARESEGYDFQLTY